MEQGYRCSRKECLELVEESENGEFRLYTSSNIQSVVIDVKLNRHHPVGETALLVGISSSRNDWNLVIRVHESDDEYAEVPGVVSMNAKLKKTI